MDEYIKGLITGLFECYNLWSKSKRRETIGKINALSNLLVENRAYLRDFSHRGQSNPEKETELAKEWKRVGTLFQNIYPQLSELCEYKSGYWVNPDIYSERKVEELGITIRNIETQLKNAKEELL